MTTHQALIKIALLLAAEIQRSAPHGGLAPDVQRDLDRCFDIASQLSE